MANNMHEVPKAWARYQQQVRNLFRSMGLNAENDVELQGVRGKHAVDVVVRLVHFGIRVLWVVECKLWKTNVPKEKVLALQALVQDVGADRGLLFSETGFQAGAVSAARQSNVLLTSIEELQKDAAAELLRARLWRYAEELESVTHSLHKLTRSKGSSSGEMVSSVIYCPPDYLHVFGRLVTLEMSLKAARRGDANGVVIPSANGDEIVQANDLDHFFLELDRRLEEARKYLVRHKDWDAKA
jgi:hypothetical protein